MTSEESMKLKTPLILSFVIIGAMVIVSAWAWFALPAGASMPIHWNIRGEVDGWTSKEIALTVLPLATIGLTALLAVLTRVEPRRANLAKSAKLYVSAWIGGLLVLLLMHIAAVLVAFGVAIPIDRILPPILGVFFIVMGNYLGKTRSNFFAGVRTPWTISSDYSWEKTHRLTGRLFVATGLATIALSALVGGTWAIYAFIAGILISTVAALVMSYVYWREDPQRTSGHINGA